MPPAAGGMVDASAGPFCDSEARHDDRIELSVGIPRACGRQGQDFARQRRRTWRAHPGFQQTQNIRVDSP
jgi:hypothetical protein